MNIVLIGYRCCGKTTVGKILAQKLKRDFVDLDMRIEKTARCSIEEMVQTRGWPYFRAQEKEVVQSICKKDNLVIATGGGVIMDPANVASLKQKGFLVWLDAQNSVLEERMAKDQETGCIRPSLTGNTAKDEIRQVLEARRPLYAKAADLKEDTSFIGPDEVAADILAALPQPKKGL